MLVHSRIEVLKNIDTVIRGFAQFHAASQGSHLHVVGDGPARASLQALAAQLLPAGAFTFHGYLSDAELRRVYDACDVFALLPLDEPFGMVFPEAAAKGLLLIGPDHGGPLEILDGGRLGWCVDAFSPEALAQALSQVASLSDAEADRRRAQADQACRDAFCRGGGRSAACAAQSPAGSGERRKRHRIGSPVRTAKSVPRRHPSHVSFAEHAQVQRDMLFGAARPVERAGVRGHTRGQGELVRVGACPLRSCDALPPARS